MKSKATLAILITGMVFGSTAQASPLDLDFTYSSQYLGIHLGTVESGADVFSVGSDGGRAGSDNRSALGRINPLDDKPATAPPIDGPAASSGAQTVPDARLSNFGGNIALTGSDTRIDLSTTDTYALTGLGIDCAKRRGCIEGNSNSNFFTPDGENPDTTTPIGTNEGRLRVNNGVNQNVDLDALYAEVGSVRAAIEGLAPTDFTNTLDLRSGIGGGSAGYIDNFNSGTSNGDFILSEWVDSPLNSGLNIIDVRTGGNDFNINNTNFIVDGEAGSSFVFVIDNNEDMLVTNSRILAGENMDLNSIMFAVVSDTNDTHFNFSQSEVWGAAFWDLSSKDNDYDGSIVMNNVRGCGQWVSNKLGDWNDVALTNCWYKQPKTTEVPEPPVLAIFAVGLIALGLFNRRCHA